MKKILLSAAAFAVVAVSAVSIAPTTSEAIPAFARQTGAACLSCHFQSFPTISAFGRAFKQGAFTDVGEQALIEDDELSIPSVLNATVVIRPQINSTKTAPTVGVSTKSHSISYGDQVLLIAGRIGTNSGAFVELGGGAFGNHQFINSWDFGAVRGGVSYFNTGFGEDAGMQLSNVWGQHGGMINSRSVSANHRMFKGAVGGGQIAGLTGFVANEMFTVQAGVVAPSLDATTFGTGGNGTFRAAPMVRVNSFMDVADMSAGIGAILVSGNVGLNGQYVANQLEMKRWGIDAQLEGEIGDMSFGIYADYANAAASAVGKTNAYNLNTVNAMKGYSLRANVKPLHNVVAGVCYGTMETGHVSTDVINVAAEYEVYQNFVIALIWNEAKTTGTAADTKVTSTTVDIEALM
ncbi:MAG: hypothetical protein R8K50_05140 [Mariprofundus sp.]